MILPVFHFLAFSINVITLWYDQKYVKFPFRKEILDQNLPFNNRVLFLTIWCLVLQTFYYFIAFLNDIFGSNAATKKTPIIRKIKDSLFSLAFPIALYVATSFWAIYAVDKELILPEPIAKVMPVWVNHVMHTFIAPFIVLEMLLSNRNYPSRRVGITLSLVFTLTYLVWLSITYNVTGVWVYPVLEVLNWPLRIVFFAVSLLLGIGMYILGEKLDGLVNPPLRRKPIDAKKLF